MGRLKNIKNVIASDRWSSAAKRCIETKVAWQSQVTFKYEIASGSALAITIGPKMKTISPTPYPDVNEIVHLLLINVKEILHDQFIGMYLFGSLTTGDFDQHSDIDILIVTKDKISQSEFFALREMHARIAKIDSPWAIQLEVSYIPQRALRRFDRSNSIIHPRLDRGHNETLHMMAHESDWIIQRHLLHEHGLALEGPDPRDLIDPVSPDDLRQAIVNVLPLWVDPILHDPSPIHNRGYQSFVVLSLCRMLFTLQHGKVVSKQVAANWAIDTLDKKWNPLIERAWVGRQNPGLNPQPEDVNGTLDLIRYLLAYSRQIQDQTNGAQTPEIV